MDKYRGELALMYMVNIHPTTGNLHSLNLIPRKICHLRLEDPSPEEHAWLYETLSAQFATRRLTLEHDLNPKSNVKSFVLRA
jgi:hypothetical protein